MKMLKENAILSEIAKDKRLNEDSRNPGKYFQLLQNMENIDAESWNATKNQAVRDAMVRPFVQEFWDKYKEEMDKSDIEALFYDMESSNFHTEYGVLRDIIRKDAYKMNEAAGDRNLNSNIGGDDMKLNESIMKNLKEAEAYGDSENDLNHDAGYLSDYDSVKEYLNNLKSILVYNSDQYVAEISNLDKGGSCKITIDYYMLVELCKMYEERLDELKKEV